MTRSEAGGFRRRGVESAWCRSISSEVLRHSTAIVWPQGARSTRSAAPWVCPLKAGFGSLSTNGRIVSRVRQSAPVFAMGLAVSRGRTDVLRKRLEEVVIHTFVAAEEGRPFVPGEGF